MRLTKVLIIITVLLGLLLSPLFTGTAYANWYALYQQGNFYGIWATIHTQVDGHMLDLEMDNLTL